MEDNVAFVVVNCDQEQDIRFLKKVLRSEDHNLQEVDNTLQLTLPGCQQSSMACKLEVPMALFHQSAYDFTSHSRCGRYDGSS